MTWTEAATVPGQAAAIEITPTDWYAATTQGLFSSIDRGSSWAPIQFGAIE